jgi:hypothetical protein
MHFRKVQCLKRETSGLCTCSVWLELIPLKLLFWTSLFQDCSLDYGIPHSDTASRPLPKTPCHENLQYAVVQYACPALASLGSNFNCSSNCLFEQRIHPDRPIIPCRSQWGLLMLQSKGRLHNILIRWTRPNAQSSIKPGTPLSRSLLFLRRSLRFPELGNSGRRITMHIRSLRNYEELMMRADAIQMGRWLHALSRPRESSN